MLELTIFTGSITSMAFIGVAVLVVVLLLFGGLSRYPYRKQEALFTAAERNFLRALDRAIGSEYRVFGKIRVADVITPKKMLNKSRWWRYFTKVSSKHIDYAIVDRSSLAILCCIELDDSSHSRKERAKRDVFLDGAFNAAGLPLVRVPARRKYDIENLRKQVMTAIKGQSVEAPQQRDQQAKQNTQCPRCGSALSVKTTRKGKNAGRQFMGCSGFPECRYTENIVGDRPSSS